MTEQERNLRVLGLTAAIGAALVVIFLTWWLYEGVGYWWDEMSYASSSGPRQGWVPLPVGAVPRTLPPTRLGPGETGAKLYFNNCGFCHAADGSGDTPVGQEYVPRPPDLRAAVSQRSDLELLTAISAGMSTPEIDTQPPIGPRWHAFEQYLSPPELQAVTAYVRATFGGGGSRTAEGKP